MGICLGTILMQGDDVFIFNDARYNKHENDMGVYLYTILIQANGGIMRLNESMSMERGTWMFWKRECE